MPAPRMATTKVDLVVLLVIGDPLAGDDEVVLAQLLLEQGEDLALGVVDQSGLLGQRDSHSISPSPGPRVAVIRTGRPVL